MPISPDTGYVYYSHCCKSETDRTKGLKLFAAKGK